MIALMALRGECLIVGVDARLVRAAQRLDDRAWRRRVRRGMDAIRATSPATLVEVLHQVIASAGIP